MNEALYGAPKLMGMAICLESERNAAIARAERAEAAIEQSASANLKLREELADVYRRAERAEAALIGRIELCTELSREIQRLRQRAERAEAALAAVPWQALLNISHALEASDAARDPDEAALLAFLNQYAPWVPNESEG